MKERLKKKRRGVSGECCSLLMPVESAAASVQTEDNSVDTDMQKRHSFKQNGK